MTITILCDCTCLHGYGHNHRLFWAIFDSENKANWVHITNRMAERYREQHSSPVIKRKGLNQYVPPWIGCPVWITTGLSAATKTCWIKNSILLLLFMIQHAVLPCILYIGIGCKDEPMSHEVNAAYNYKLAPLNSGDTNSEWSLIDWFRWD